VLNGGLLNVMVEVEVLDVELLGSILTIFVGDGEISTTRGVATTEVTVVVELSAARTVVLVEEVEVDTTAVVVGGTGNANKEWRSIRFAIIPVSL
jgi:hypothetical protein